MKNYTRKSHKYTDATRVLLLCMLIALGSVIGNNKMYADELNGTASMDITLLEIDGITFDVDIELVFLIGDNYQWSAQEQAAAIEVYVNGEVVEQSFVAGQYDDTFETAGYKLSLTDVAAGALIEVKNVIVDTLDPGETYQYIDGAKTAITVTGSDENFPLDITNDGVGEFSSTETLNFDVTLKMTNSLESEPDQDTNYTSDTFLTTGGSYDLEYLLSHYNVISRNDIVATHIVGPIIAGASVYYHSDDIIGSDTVTPTASISVSDYAKGISSFIGDLLPLDAGWEVTSTALLTYGFENTDAGFVLPAFYTTLSDVFISLGEETWTQWYVTKDDVTFKSPNYSAQGDIYQNDYYVDFSEMYGSILAQGEDLVDEGSIEGQQTTVVQVTPADYVDGVLTIDAEKSYTILDATGLDTIRINYPEDYDDETNNYLDATTVSFAGDNLSKITLDDGETYSIFPVIELYLNGEKIVNSYGSGGKGVEYGEQGNQIVFNLPYVTGSMVLGDQNDDIQGHIIAPNVDLYRYAFTGTTITGWGGGNINGCVIVNDFHSGVTELHMFPYTGTEMQMIEVIIEGDKTFIDGDLSDMSFDFILELVDESQESDFTAGIFPLTATTDAQGNFVFDDIEFSKTGTYEFMISEVIPDSTGSVIYDQSVYMVTVDITITNSQYVSNVTISKVVNSEGEQVSESVDTIYFENSIDQPSYEDFVLPNTGGFGALHYYVLGIMVIGLSIILKKEERGGN